MRWQLLTYLEAEHYRLKLAHGSLMMEFECLEHHPADAFLQKRLREHRQLLANHHLALYWVRTLLDEPTIIRVGLRTE